MPMEKIRSGRADQSSEQFFSMCQATLYFDPRRGTEFCVVYILDLLRAFSIACAFGAARPLEWDGLGRATPNGLAFRRTV